MILEKVEEAWRSMGTSSHPTSPSFLPQAQWGIASFAPLTSPERCAQASLEGTVKWTETQSFLEDKTVESLALGWEDMQATHEESVNGHDTLETIYDVSSDIDPSSDPCLMR